MDRLDENTAWLNFTSTGKVEDYLIYCTAQYEDTDKGTYSDRAERWRER